LDLPLSGLSIAFREPDGEDETLFAELAPDRPAAAGVVLLQRLGRTRESGNFDPGCLALTDFEAALVALRCHLLGPEASSEASCPACGERVELGFSFDSLAEAAQPRRMAGATWEAGGGGGEIDGVRFRLPTAADACACEGRPDAPARLLELCAGHLADRRLRRRVERAMSGFAPLLSRIVAAPCAGCSAILRTLIHVPTFVVSEIAWGARAVFEEVHLLASAYGWREADILALPRARRRRYAARLRAA
jgi:hypothetical protein